MKLRAIIVCGFFLVGCTSPRPSASLTAEQARALAIRLANDKAATVYHCQPFQDSQPAHFIGGHWVWTDHRGFGRGDIQTTVELAADGSTHNVDLKLLDSTLLY